MNCSAGHPNVEGAAFCASCGLAMGAAPPAAAWPAPTVAAPSWAPGQTTATWPAAPPSSGNGGGQLGAYRAPQNGMGTAALILGIVGLLLFGCIFGVLAIIFGSIGISRANAGLANNKGVAIAGLILGIVGFVGWSLIFLASSGL